LNERKELDEADLFLGLNGLCSVRCSISVSLKGSGNGRGGVRKLTFVFSTRVSPRNQDHIVFVQFLPYSSTHPFLADARSFPRYQQWITRFWNLRRRQEGHHARGRRDRGYQRSVASFLVLFPLSSQRPAPRSRRSSFVTPS